MQYFEGVDTSVIGRKRCPTCEPVVEIDDICYTEHCPDHVAQHMPGVDDSLTRDPEHYIPAGEAGGLVNQIMCNRIHRPC